MTDRRYTKNILEYATFGINENIDADAKVEVKLRDLVFIAQTLQEFIQYFHNRDHYLAIEDIHEYLGSRKNGRAYHLLSKANYEVMERMLPKTLDDLYDAGVFDSPEMPFYFEPKE
ncbi:MAG: hypothetical protein ABJN69_08115 [Hellea sp.]